jgi:preprotein translocase subunit SecA
MYHVSVVTEEQRQLEDHLQNAQASHGEETSDAEARSKKKPVRSEHVGRNDLCPCGSGKKYKNCCGKNK